MSRIIKRLFLWGFLVITTTACTNLSENDIEFKDNHKILADKNSPNGKYHFVLEESSDSGKYASTFLYVNFQGCGSLVYNPAGKNLNLNVYWQDDDTIIVESPKNVTDNLRHSFARCFAERVQIKYIGK